MSGYGARPATIVDPCATVRSIPQPVEERRVDVLAIPLKAGRLGPVVPPDHDAPHLDVRVPETGAGGHQHPVMSR